MQRSLKFTLTFLGLALIMVLIVATMGAEAAQPGIQYSPMDVGPEVRAWEPTIDHISGRPDFGVNADAAVRAAAAVELDCAMGAKTFLTLDNYNGAYFFTSFNLLAESESTQIWVQDDLSWPAGDPRDTPVVTCDQASYLLAEFDDNIAPIEHDFFGAPDSLDGSLSLLEAWGYVPEGYYADANGRQVVLVANVRDDNYFDSTYPLYIAGFYSSSLEAYFDRNTMTIDAFDWADRTGPDGSRPYLYEGVFAHEYQHLLHDDYDSDEENFVNEGMADLAAYLTGYAAFGANDGHVNAAMSNPENSLVLWGDQGDLEILTDYGNSYLFQLYLLEQFGPKFVQAEFLNQENGISGVNSTLSDFKISKTFGDVYHDWNVAMLIDDEKSAGGRYGFKAVDLEMDIGEPGAWNPEAYDTPGAPPWGTDYMWIDKGNAKELAKFTFNGMDYAVLPSGWSVEDGALYGGHENLDDNWAIFEVTAGSTLSFDTMYDIEDYWDFGFVQVSTDAGYTWTSLENESTTFDHDPSAHPKVIANLPGLTGNTGGAWVSMSFDLSAYSGDILVAFRYVTDWSTLHDGWYVDNVYVDETLVWDGSPASMEYKDLTQIVPINQDFSVTFVGMRQQRGDWKYKVLRMKLDEVTEKGMFELNSILKNSNKVAFLVTFDAPEDFAGYADYSYDFTLTNAGKK